jgi:hypothetical protein
MEEARWNAHHCTGSRCFRLLSGFCRSFQTRHWNSSLPPTSGSLKHPQHRSSSLDIASTGDGYQRQFMVDYRLLLKPLALNSSNWFNLHVFDRIQHQRSSLCCLKGHDKGNHTSHTALIMIYLSLPASRRFPTPCMIPPNHVSAARFSVSGVTVTNTITSFPLLRPQKQSIRSL